MKHPGQGVLIMAGGTGGHIFPGLAVAAALKRRNIPVRWLGVKGGMEALKVPQADIKLDLVAITGLRGKGFLRWLRMPLLLLRAVWQARRLLELNRPRCALSFGGYAAAPGGFAAWTKGIPLLVHEQNRIPGLTNRSLARIARKTLQGFPATFPEKLHPIDSGNPIRIELTELPLPADRLAERSGPIRVLITGGSQGAKILNQQVPAAMALLSSSCEFELRHQAGSKRIDEAARAYDAAGVEAKVCDFVDDMAEVYTWADLVICRSGALTVTELAAVGVASVLVPFALAVDDHQTCNAEYLASAGAAVIVPQATMTAQTLSLALQPLLADRGVLLSMACTARQLAMPGAVEKVVEACLEWVNP